MTVKGLKEYIEDQIRESESMAKQGFFSEYGEGALETYREILKKLKEIK